MDPQFSMPEMWICALQSFLMTAMDVCHSAESDFLVAHFVTLMVVV
jgi:hypothetical protein